MRARPHRVRVERDDPADERASPLPEPRYVRYLEAGMGKVPDDVVARKLGVLKGAVKSWRKRLGIPISAEVAEDLIHRRPRESDCRLAERIRRLAEQDLSFTRIVLLARADRKRVRRLIRKYGIDVPSRYRGGTAPELALRKVRKGVWLKPYRARLLARHGRAIHTLAAKGLNATAIGGELGLQRGTVCSIARWMGIRIEPGRENWDWSSVDWSRPNRDIAQEMGTDTNEVSRARRSRRARGKSIPRSPFPRMTEETRRKNSEALRRRYRRGHELLAKRIRPLARLGLTAEDLARRLGVSGSSVRAAAKALGIVLARPHRREEWIAIDWNRSNQEIARTMGVQRQMVSKMRLKLRREGLAVPGSPDPRE